MRPAPTVAGVLFLVVALAHALRWALGVEVTVGGAALPMWVSCAGTIVPAALAVWLLRDARRRGTIPAP